MNVHISNKPVDPSKLKIRQSLIKILTGSDLSRRRLPFMSISSPVPGPVVWLTACTHGDEVGGLVVIQEIFKLLQRRLVKGVVNAFPLMNPIGFETISRNITFSREDLNRSFPGNAEGTLGERIAYQIFSKIIQTAPTFLLDLHNDWKRSVPYVLLDRKSEAISGTAYDFSRRICQKTGFYVVEDTQEIRSSLTHNLIQQGIPAVTFELGESYVVNEKIIEYGVNSILQVLSDCQMVDLTFPPENYPLHDRYQSDQVLRYSDKPFCTRSGILRFLAKPGQMVNEGQPLAKIYNAFGKLQETLTAVNRGIVLGSSDSAVAFPGMSPMVFGIF
ncbi:MAG: succinylglutamate desuccinylase/aspartoacylase family protein [bacterium]